MHRSHSCHPAHRNSVHVLANSVIVYRPAFPRFPLAFIRSIPLRQPPHPHSCVAFAPDRDIGAHAHKHILMAERAPTRTEYIQSIAHNRTSGRTRRHTSARPFVQPLDVRRRTLHGRGSGLALESGKRYGEVLTARTDVRRCLRRLRKGAAGRRKWRGCLHGVGKCGPHRPQ